MGLLLACSRVSLIGVVFNYIVAKMAKEIVA